MKTIGCGLIGAGFMGKCHALAMNAVAATLGGTLRPRLEILCDADAASAGSAAAALGFVRSTADWRALVNDPAVGIVSITAPNRLHRAVAEAALAAGKHVWCEKPMALTLADAEAMASAAARAGTVTLLGYNYIQNPAFRHMQRLAGEGAIGRILHIRGQFDEDYLASPAEPWSWRQKKSEAGLGVLGDLMCHLVSLVHEAAGPVARLSASWQKAYAERQAPGGGARAVENEDIAQALIELEGGATGVLMASRAAHGRKNLLRLELHGTEGMLAFDQERMNELEFFEARGGADSRGFRRILTGPLHAPYKDFCPAPGHQLGFNDLKVIEAGALLDAISGKAQGHIDFAKGLAIERVIHAMARSAEEQVRVTV